MEENKKQFWVPSMDNKRTSYNAGAKRKTLAPKKNDVQNKSIKGKNTPKSAKLSANLQENVKNGAKNNSGAKKQVKVQNAKTNTAKTQAKKIVNAQKIEKNSEKKTKKVATKPTTKGVNMPAKRKVGDLNLTAEQKASLKVLSERNQKKIIANELLSDNSTAGRVGRDLAAKKQIPDLGKSNLRVTFLGGIGEIGKNMTLLEYGDDMIMIDAGQSFADETVPGIDSVVQDLTYLEANKNKLRAIFITHGHEDHIGGLWYTLKTVKAPIYGSAVSLGLIEGKLAEAKELDGTVLKCVKPGATVSAGKFKVEFVSVTHSIPGAFGLAITTPVGTVFHTGDFKIDATPIGNDYCDLKRIAELGKKGVLLLMSDSTNVERQGFSLSESVVGKTFKQLISSYKNQRIIIATFASNIHRLQQIADYAKEYHRKITFTGRSMINVTEMAMKIGELHCDRDLIVDIDKIDKYADNEIIIVSTGSQGEVMSALNRMALDDYPKVKLGDNDVVILSSSPIPGNEKQINNLINQLYRKNCKIIYNEIAEVHASGHAYKEELKIIMSLVRPKFFIPIHGEYRHLKNQQLLAKEMGIPERNVIIPELGMQVEVGKDFIKVAGQVPAGDVLIDGTGRGDKDSDVIRDRLYLAKEGMCVVVVKIDENSKRLVARPRIFSRGFIYKDELSEILTGSQDYIMGQLDLVDLKSFESTREMEAYIKKIALAYFSKHTKRRPMIVPIVVEV